MIAQLFLSIMLAGILLYAWTEYRRSPVIALSALVVALGGLYFVWLPAHATVLAEMAGVGRGVDLIIYVWVVISLLVMFNLHLKLRVQLELITVLARQSAIANSQSGAAGTYQPATSSSPPRIAAIPANSRKDSASPNNNPPS